MSHKGTMPVDPEVTALESCRRAAKRCDLFLGIILPRYGSGKEDREDDSIVHEEFRIAIEENKPRWILAHEQVVFARSFIENLCKGSALERKDLKIKPSPVFEDLRILDMYDLATRHDVKVYRDKKGNWVQKFGSTDEASLYAVSQFRRYQEAEAFVDDTFGNQKPIKKLLNKKGDQE